MLFVYFTFILLEVGQEHPLWNEWTIPLYKKMNEWTGEQTNEQTNK